MAAQRMMAVSSAAAGGTQIAATTRNASPGKVNHCIDLDLF